MAEKKPLPPDVIETDLKYEAPRASDAEADVLAAMHSRLTHEDRKALGIDYDTGWTGYLTFYLTDKMGWCVTTLAISGGNPPRTYGAKIKDGAVVTIGKGPHVKAVVEVHVRKDNLERLKKYLELWKKGMIDAGNIRDRRSSRIAQGQIERANGKHSWRWDT